MQDLKKTIESKYITKPELVLEYLGLLDYNNALAIQNNVSIQVKQYSNKIFLLGMEHPKVITLGYRADEKNEVLAINKIPLVKIDRGGLATIHSEGQLVIYPILNLNSFKIGVKDYVCILLQATRDLLAEYGIATVTEDKAIGLYTAKGKIAFCGIQVKGGITRHGISLNVKNDLSLFKNIIACGVSSPQLDSMANCGIEVELNSLYIKWCHYFEVQLNKTRESSLCN